MYGYKLGLKKVGESVPAAPANVVQPLLSGNGAIGTVVTSSTGSWTGFPTPTFTFDFKIDNASVQNGESNTYTPLIGEDTKTLTVTVTATNSQGSVNADSSNSLVVGTIPVNTVAPTVFGDNTFGSTLTTTDGTFTGTAPITYTYQWNRNDSPIAGQTANTYVIGSSDSLANITCEVTGTNSYGFDSEVSNTITVENFAPVNTVAPTVSPSGTQSTGTLITANTGTWTGVAPITFEYKWTRNGIAISGATASTYTIQLADDGTTIRVEVKGTNAYGVSAFVASSNSVSAVNTVAPTNSVAPVISGTAVVGQTLTTTTGTWSGIPTPTFSYQWKRGATNIGTNATTYTLVAADAGNTSNITCVVTATNAGGSANATSNQIAQILTARTSSFLTASAITDATIRGGLNTFDIGLISNSLDTKMVAVYPMVGGTATTHKFNFMNSADTDAAFRLAFSGGWIHTSNGAKPNGTNTYANTFCLPTSTARSAYGVYTTEQLDTGVRVVMAQAGAAAGYMSPGLGVLGVRGSGTLTGYPNTTKGMIMGFDIDTTTSYYANINGTGQTVTRAFTAFNANTYFIGAFSTTIYFTNNNLAFSFIGGLANQTEATALRTLVQALQTTLSRQV
jgi:hypothetical protein